jgi:hypothetical protein
MGLEPGATNTIAIVVDESMTADRFGNTGVQVLATPIGMRVTFRATLTQRNGRRLVFRSRPTTNTSLSVRAPTSASWSTCRGSAARPGSTTWTAWRAPLSRLAFWRRTPLACTGKRHHDAHLPLPSPSMAAGVSSRRSVRTRSAACTSSAGGG